MQNILDKLTEWLITILIDGIITNLSGMFEQVNQRVGEIAGEVGLTPAPWNAGVIWIPPGDRATTMVSGCNPYPKSKFGLCCHNTRSRGFRRVT